MEVVIPYTPRPLQRQVHDTLKRFSVIVCHRRWGKTVFAINELIRTTLTCTKKAPKTHYICPLHKQAKAVAWDYCKEFSRPIPGIKVNESELRIDYPNGGRLQLLGADNVDGIRGIYSDHVVLDEFAQMSHRAWSEVIRPALSDREGKAIFIGTPAGHNNFYDLYQRADELEGWGRHLYKASETDILPEGELKAARREMTDAEYAQEYECSWSAAIRGAYYAKEMAAAEDDGRVGNVPYDPMLEVVTSWDLGVADATAVWFWQVSGPEIRAIDYMEFQGLGLPDIIKQIDEKPYKYGQHIAPHDIAVRELGSGRTRHEIARSLGVEFTVAPNQRIAEGIAALRVMIPRIWFDKDKCKQGIEALKQYRTEYDDKRQVFRTNPLHNWCSHPADSARYFAITPLRAGVNANYDWSKPLQ